MLSYLCSVFSVWLQPQLEWAAIMQWRGNPPGPGGPGGVLVASLLLSLLVRDRFETMFWCTRG